jgi:hypothetical protein
MYLFHNTTLKSLKLILEDGNLKSSKLTNNTKGGQGFGIYDTNPFVYFSTTDILFDNRVCSMITLYFDSKLLYNRNFYISTVHSDNPTDLAEWKSDLKNLEYKRKYKKNYKYYDKILLNLYKNSTDKLPKGKSFQIFQQIAINNKVNLNDLVAIQFNFQEPTKSILKFINRNYPNIQIYIYDNYKNMKKI